MRSQAIVEFGTPLSEIEAPTPEPKGTEVLLKVHHAGVCHSDVHIHDGYFDLGGGNKLPMKLPLPHTMGHEIEGEIIAAGPDASGAKIGERYAAFPWIGCGQCAACQRDEENLCIGRPRQLGCSPGVPGGFATHVLVPHPKYLLDYGSVSPALAAAYMCSGLTAFGAMKKVGRLGPGDQIVVLGCGGVGMMGIEFACALHGKGPIAADIVDAHLDAATKGGAVAAYNTKEPGAAKRLVADTGGVYAVVDFVGSEASFAFANAVVRRGGKIVVVGLFGGAMTMPLPMFPLRALTIMGSFVGSLPEAREMMALVREGKVSPIPLQSRALSDANRTLDDLRQGNIVGRVVLTP
ncbi:MAG: alcohol dehydrogenase catalytic domain-containing protein [Alphaproteobacteria bacterium]|nr:alcohol dehydrogenase catalytic domain-containing protein [Alphaproteobacteria bacterium]MBV9063270.1 alcohol dehydrogenase catalytic domain-containing protein [Alphaproteobacteria bacterium]